MPSPVELEISAPFAGVVVTIEHAADASVQAGAVLVVLEAMKMEHEVLAESDGIVQRVEVAMGDAIEAGALLVVLRVADGSRVDPEFGGARKG
ncbi:MAG: biotin/lipoyl-containing protein, partial [Solirubrobacteraceae bacterium]